MKIGMICDKCGFDWWIVRRKDKNGQGSRCGICEPGTHNEKRGWPRIIPVNHSKFIRKGIGSNGKHRKPYSAEAHRAIIHDIQLAQCVGFTVEKIVMNKMSDTKGERWYYKLTPLHKREFRNFREAKSWFLRGQLAKQQINTAP